MNVIARLDFEFAYYDVAVQLITLRDSIMLSLKYGDKIIKEIEVFIEVSFNDCLVFNGPNDLRILAAIW